MKSRLARASWIEILLFLNRPVRSVVEARKSLVDRNFHCSDFPIPLDCRGSQEPRGSKYAESSYNPLLKWSRLARASWIEISHHPQYNQEQGRGSQEPRGSKSRNPAGPAHLTSVEARKSLVDRNCRLYPIREASSGRGSQEPRGSKSTSHGSK